MPPFITFGCYLVAGQRPYSLSFTPRAGHGWPVIKVSSSGLDCVGDGVRAGGAAQPALYDPGSKVIAAMRQLLGLRTS